MPDALLAESDDLGLLVDDALADNYDKAQLLLRIASGIVRSHCRQQLTFKASDTVRVTPVDGVSAFLPELPVTAVTSVSARALDGSYSVLVATTYDIDEETGRIQLHAIPSSPSSRWEVVYSHGYATMPEAIVNVTLGLASRAWSTPLGIENERIGLRSVKYSMNSDDLTAAEIEALAPYVVPGIR